MTNPGSNAQKDAPKLRSNPAHVYSGIPIQAAAATLLRSYRPNGTANAVPKRIPMIGPHCCSFAEANSLSDNRANNVTPATMGALPSRTRPPARPTVCPSPLSGSWPPAA